MKTFSAKPHEVKRDWFVVDASDKVLGRLAADRHRDEFLRLEQVVAPAEQRSLRDELPPHY